MKPVKGRAALPDRCSTGASSKSGLTAVTPQAPGEVLFLKYSSHLTHRQMVICIIYSRLGTLIGHTSDAKPRTPQSLNESATHPPRGRPQGWTSYIAGPLHRLSLPLLFLHPQILHSLAGSYKGTFPRNAALIGEEISGDQRSPSSRWGAS